jgi:2-hydroxychromene-2-carboxylate isomerase
VGKDAGESEVDLRMTRSFAVTWDYRCPYARNAHEHLVAGLVAGADWDVEFIPFSLGQVHVPEGGTPVWDDPDKRSGLLASEVGIVVRDKFPDAFRPTHVALFCARHDEARDIREESVLREVLGETDVDADVVFSEIANGWPLESLRDAHLRSVEQHRVFGVPTFISEDRAVFVRLTTRPNGDGDLARTTIDRVIDLLDGFLELNEFKHTSIKR